MKSGQPTRFLGGEQGTGLGATWSKKKNKPRVQTSVRRTAWVFPHSLRNGQRLATVAVGTVAILHFILHDHAMVGRIQFERFAVALGERILSVLAD